MNLTTLSPAPPPREGIIMPYPLNKIASLRTGSAIAKQLKLVTLSPSPSPRRGVIMPYPLNKIASLRTGSAIAKRLNLATLSPSPSPRRGVISFVLSPLERARERVKTKPACENSQTGLYTIVKILF